MVQEHHIFHIKTKLSAGVILYSFLIGAGIVSGLAVGYHILDDRFKVLEAEILQYRQRAWLFKTVEEKLKDEKSQVRYEVAEAIWSLSKSKQIPAEIILGIIETESNWDLEASNGAAMGMMQVIPTTAAPAVSASKKDLKKGALYDPVTNIIAGCNYLSELHTKYMADKVEKSTEFDPSLCAYNSGRTLGNKNKQLTNYGYAIKVKAAASKYEALFKTPI